jgi:hypothetical protein
MLSQSCIWLSFAPWGLPRRRAYLFSIPAGIAELFRVSPPEAVVYLNGINIMIVFFGINVCN